MTARRSHRPAVSSLVGIAIAATPGLHAQSTVPTTRMVNVDGYRMRVLATGSTERRPGQPVIILEAGAGEGLDSWDTIFTTLGRLAPVVAYDRRGVGASDPDSERPSLRRVAQSLHALLRQLDLPPPYVLVGQSWGGLFVRAFADQYAPEVAGLVFLDVTDFETTRNEKAAAVSPADRPKVLAPATLPPIPPDTPAGLRAEFDVVGTEMTGGFPEARSLRLPGNVPIAVVVATPPGRLQGLNGAMVRLQIQHQAEWAFKSPNGMFLAAGHVGHRIHHDDPNLVVHLVEHVLTYASTSSAENRDDGDGR